MKISLSTITGGAAAILFAPNTTASGASSITKNMKEVIKNLRRGSTVVHEEKNRNLQSLLEAGSSSSCVTVTSLDESTNTVTVDVRQCLLGTSAGTGDQCAATDGEDADLFFATYKQQNGSSVCGFKKNRADACYVEAIPNVPCDSKTNTATVTLYARDNTLLQASDMVENPKLGECSVGNGKWARYTISEEVIVDCVVTPTGVNPPGTCSDTYNNCAEGEYCNFHYERGYECKAYVPVGETCGGLAIFGEQNICDPSISFCYESDSCFTFIADSPGTCEAFASLPEETCKTDADCDTSSGEWCDINVGKCKYGIKEGACCDVLQDNCDVGLMCAPQSTEGNDGGGFAVLGSEATVCQPEGGPVGNNPPGTCSDTYSNCGEGEYCNLHWERGFECKAYVNVGDYCGGYVMQGEDNRCDPMESFCSYPDGCYSPIADAPGKCEALASLPDETCSSNADCDTSAGEWCDVKLGKCKNGIAEGDCCAIQQNNCDVGLTCAPQLFEFRGEQNVCQSTGGPIGNNPPGTCSDTYNNCAEGEYCNEHWDRGFECKAYVNVGASCGGFTMQGDDNRCDPSESFCYSPDECYSMIADGPGTCEALASMGDETCTTSADCDTASGGWCDIYLGKCKNGIAEGACCDVLQDNCDIGLLCAPRSTEGSGGDGSIVIMGSEATVCQPEGVGGPVGNNNPPGTCSDTYDNCAEGEYCNNHWERGYECKAYVNVGASCGGYTRQGDDGRCDPSEAFCYYPDYCMIADVPGTCQAFASSGDETCQTNDECDTASGEWCDVDLGKCKYGLDNGACCDNNSQNCDIGYTCENTSTSTKYTRHMCQPVAP